MAVAAFCVLSALGLIVAVQASCSLRTNQNSYAPRDQKTALGLSTHKSVSSDWRIVDAESAKIALSGALKVERSQPLVGALNIETFMADFSGLTAPGSYKIHVDGCSDAPLFTIQNPLFEQHSLVSASNNKTHYSDPGISRGAGIALVVITVLLFVVLLVLIGWVTVIYCC